MLVAAALSLGALSGQVPQLHPHPNGPAGAKMTPIVAKTARRTTTVYRHRRPLEAAFAREGYRPGESARLGIWGDFRRLTVQIFRVGPERRRTRRNDELNGVPVSEPRVYPAQRTLRIRVGDWSSGVYFARLEAHGDQLAFAPFLVRPGRLGEHRVAVVMPTNTWQAYNFRDDDRDGSADSWYADRSRRTVRINRPYLYRGVPIRSYDLPFLHWLAWTEREVDYLAQLDVERVARAGRLRRAYDLIIFPGHHEYVTGREYDVITKDRNLGGNLMFLSANNFFWRVGPTSFAMRAELRGSSAAPVFATARGSGRSASRSTAEPQRRHPARG